jgi:BirA family biotin operon repressor/biotin-[acetyl-CoA-carboxylase] ligase
VLPNLVRSGIVQGVNTKGELLLETEAGLETVNAGELSLRLKNAFTD